ncbi:hypothetical protein [Sphingobacterium sp. LRF_L2]|uniref:hypothetical protein n=1 Tax=Sphingobacterium sp. LRF_L2 TaxID=3369421 RepID=UPI003F5D7A9E
MRIKTDFDLFITSDAWWESKMSKVLGALTDTGFRAYFYEQNYGTSLTKIMIDLVCLDPEYNKKQKARFSKNDKELSIDLVFDLALFMRITQEERNRIVLEKLIAEVPAIIAKYKFEDFDLPTFEKDFKKWMSKIL